MPVVLLVAEGADANVVREALGSAWKTESASNVPTASERLQASAFDAVVVALHLSAGEARGALGGLKASVKNAPLVVVDLEQAGTDSDALAFTCLGLGIQYFVARSEIATGGLNRCLALATTRKAPGQTSEEPSRREGLPPSSLQDAERPFQRRVLLVDDDDVVRRIVGSMLETRYSVTLAEGGQEALDVLGRGAAFDAIFCDVTMQDMDGLSLAEAIRSKHPALHPRIVLLSGGAIDGTSRESIERSGLRLLLKPCSLAQLCDAVESAAAP